MAEIRERVSSSEKKKLYVGCGLTLAPQEFKDRVEETKDALRTDWDVMEFLGLVDGDEKDVFQRDIIDNVGSCDAFVGICDEPSIGLGWELCTSAAIGKPTLGLAHSGSKITRLILGAPAFFDNLTFRRYEDMVRDVPTIVAEEFEVVRNALVVPKPGV